MPTILMLKFHTNVWEDMIQKSLSLPRPRGGPSRTKNVLRHQKGVCVCVCVCVINFTELMCVCVSVRDLNPHQMCCQCFFHLCACVVFSHIMSMVCPEFKYSNCILFFLFL